MQQYISSFILVVAFLTASCAKEPSHPALGPDEDFNRCAHLMQKKKFEEAVECMEIVKARYPQSTVAREAELKIGDAHFDSKDYLLAAESYVAFLHLYPLSPKADYAHYRAGVAYFRASPKAIDRDQDSLGSAIEHLETLVNHYPQSAYKSLGSRFLQDARNRVARRHFYVGRYYWRAGEYLAAIPRFHEVADQYVDSGLAPKALYLMTLSYLKLKNLDGGKETFSQLATEYPQNKWTARAATKLRRAAGKTHS